MLKSENNFFKSVEVRWSFKSQKWFTCNFSLQYPYIIQQAGNENIQTNQVEVFILI